MLYYRFCETLTDYGKYIPVTDNIYEKMNSSKDYYRSIYLYNEEQVKQAEELIEVEKSGKKYKRPRGIAGITDVVTKELVWDFDSNDLKEARLDTLELVNRLQNAGFDVEKIGLFLSGGKGFHVHVSIDQQINPIQFKQISKKFASGLKTYDSVVSNPSRVIRMPFSRHQKTGLYKTRLSLEELQDFTVDLKEIAKNEYEPTNIEEVELPDLRFEEKQADLYDVEIKDTVDLTRNPMNLSPWKLALSQGFFPPGQRNNALMILTATLKNKDYDADEAYSYLKSTIRKQAERFNQDKYSKEEFYQKVVEVVYRDTWTGGTYAEDNFPEELQEYLVNLGVPRFADVGNDEDLVVDVTTGIEGFYDYAVNIDKNRLNFGVPELDNVLKPQKGHLIGLLAGPGIGKTSLALTLLNNTSKDGCKSFFGSYDMNSKILFQKLLQRETRMTDDEIYEVYKKGDTEQIDKFKTILQKNYENVTFSFKVGETIKDLKKSIARTEQKLGEKIGLVVVDYIELIMSEKSDATQASAEAAQGLREIANSGKVVVVLLQPNKMSSRADEAPKSYNAAKGSSAIPQAVTSMIGCFRPGYDPEDTSMDKFFGITILKNRMGPLGTVYLNWHGPTGRITTMEDIERQELQQYLDMKKESKGNEDL